MKLTRVPASMQNLFQRLDLTVIGSPNAFLNKKFTEWYNNFSISKELQEGKSIKDIDVELKLSILIPLHGKWINEVYDCNFTM